MILDIYEKCNADDGCRERWKRWEHHRLKIQNILQGKIFTATKLENAVVLGAGRCEDIDLKFLLQNVEVVTLVDYDFASMERALERQQLTLEERKRILLKGNVEFTGFYSEEIINAIISKLESKESHESIMQFIKSKLQSINNDLSKLLDSNKYSLVISGAVHSQLIVPYTEIATDSKHFEKIMKEAAYIANILAENYNKTLLSLLKEEGWLFSYFDVMELSEKNNTLQFEQHINALISQNEFDKIDKFFLQNGGVAGARHGYQDLYELVKNYKPYLEAWIWNFRDSKKYYIRSLCFKYSEIQNL